MSEITQQKEETWRKVVRAGFISLIIFIILLVTLVLLTGAW